MIIDVFFDVYPAATLEGSLTTDGLPNAVFKERDYYSIDGAYIVAKTDATGITGYANKNGGAAALDPPVNNNPNSNATANSEKLYKLNAATNKTGLGITLKVMADDKVNIFGRSYWFNSGGNFNDKFPIPVLGLLDAFLASPSMAAKGIATATLNTTPFADAASTYLQRADNPGYPAPWAYINWVLLDEQFNYVSGGADRIGASGIVKVHDNTTIPTISVAKNGYIFVYCSNESNYNVFFDNLQLIHTQGALLEETHYYPFGLTMQGISSRAANTLENKRKWNAGSELASKEFSDGSGLELYETFYRSLDPQIGRFWQIDPKPNYMESPYVSMGNNPILNNDPLGDTLLNKADQRTANRIEKQINKTNASLNKQATKLNSKIAAADAKGNTAKADRLRGNLADVNARIATNTNTLGNLNAIRDDQTQAYTFNQLPSGSTEGGTMLKTMSVNGSNQSVVVMNILSDANAVHELTHAAQGAIQNMFTFNLDNAANPVTFRGATVFAAQQVNANSEIAAYQAQYAFSPGSMPSSTMGGVPGSMNNINAFYVGGINGTNAAGAAVPIYPNVQNMVNTIISTLLRVF